MDLLNSSKCQIKSMGAFILTLNSICHKEPILAVVYDGCVCLLLIECELHYYCHF